LESVEVGLQNKLALPNDILAQMNTLASKIMDWVDLPAARPAHDFCDDSQKEWQR
jgi:hypothetical protein